MGPSCLLDEISDFSGSAYRKKASLSGNYGNIVWNKKNYPAERCLDLKDLAIFFKIKDFKDLWQICPEEFEKFEREERRIGSWLNTFEGVEVDLLSNFCLYPPYILNGFLDARMELLSALWRWLMDQEHGERVADYFVQNSDMFDTVRSMRYSVRTTSGNEPVDLVFAENFRFKAQPDTLNLFNMPKQMRGRILPCDDSSFLYAIDFRQFEFRTLLDLVDADVDYSCKDLYGEIGQKLSMTGDAAKINIISYLYSDRDNDELRGIFDKSKIFDKIEGDYFMWDEVPIYVRASAEPNKQLHTVVQTISYFFYLDRLDKILKVLDGKKSKFIFPLHDSMIFSVNKDEIGLLEEIPGMLETDVYKIKSYVGTNFLEMKEL